jgi:hypothetical protein
MNFVFHWQYSLLAYVQIICFMRAVAERLRRAYPAPLGRAGVGSIPANPDAQNVPSFRRWRFEMKLSPFVSYEKQVKKQVCNTIKPAIHLKSNPGHVGLPIVVLFLRFFRIYEGIVGPGV